MTEPEWMKVAELHPEASPRGAYQDSDKVASLLDKFEDIKVESGGYDDAGHRIWEVYVNAMS